MLLNILVTGAAGLIGGEVCARLSARGHSVHALVHRRREVLANDGTPVALASVISGDVTKPGLGFSEDEAKAIAGRLSLVIHCAASLEFDAPRAEIDPINVGGTLNVAMFARAHGAKLLHVSTAYVCGEQNGPIPEVTTAAGQRFGPKFGNSYEASKAAGEAVVQASGVPFIIARPSVVMGEAASGRIREFPSMCNLFRLLARGSLSLLPATKTANFDLVPIDYVAGGLVALAEGLTTGAGYEDSIVHLCSATPTPVRSLVEALGKFDHFPKAQAIEFDAFSPAMLPASQARVMDRMLAVFGTYLRRDPHFDDSKFRALTGLTCPPTGEAYLLRLISYAIDAGYLPQAAVSEHQDTALPA